MVIYARARAFTSTDEGEEGEAGARGPVASVVDVVPTVVMSGVVISSPIPIGAKVFRAVPGRTVPLTARGAVVVRKDGEFAIEGARAVSQSYDEVVGAVYDSRRRLGRPNLKWEVSLFRAHFEKKAKKRRKSVLLQWPTTVESSGIWLRC